MAAAGSCHQELLPALGRLFMWPLRGDSSADPLPFCPEVLGWSGGKTAQPGATKPVHVLGKGPQLGQQPRKNPAALLFGTRDSGDTNL